MSLSDKRKLARFPDGEKGHYFEKDVKEKVQEFLKVLKEITMIDFMDEESFDVKEYYKRIDKLAKEKFGDKLI